MFVIFDMYYLMSKISLNRDKELEMASSTVCCLSFSETQRILSNFVFVKKKKNTNQTVNQDFQDVNENGQPAAEQSPVSPSATPGGLGGCCWTAASAGFPPTLAESGADVCGNRHTHTFLQQTSALSLDPPLNQ